jgi:DNA-nicking Smr family endonuclease
MSHLRCDAVQAQLQLHDTPISRARKQLTGFRVESLRSSGGRCVCVFRCAAAVRCCAVLVRRRLW